MRVISMKNQLREPPQDCWNEVEAGRVDSSFDRFCSSGSSFALEATIPFLHSLIVVVKSTVCGGCAEGSVGTVVGYREGSVVKDIVLAYAEMNGDLDRLEAAQLFQKGFTYVGGTVGAAGGAAVGAGCVIS